MFALSTNAETIYNDGKNLHLTRGANTTTFRATFEYAQDCRLIAKAMNDIEIAHWSCK